jgi:hypothetical protein
MSDEELRLLERNRLMTRRILVPMMAVLGACGFLGGIWAITTDDIAIGIGLTFSAIVMLGFAGFYIIDTRKPAERPEKFFVTGIVTKMKKTGSVVTNVYYSIELNDSQYKCFTSEEDFKKIKVGDAVMCERLEENSLIADRIVKVNP